MSNVRQFCLSILKENNQVMDLDKLSKVLWHSGRLGFGVESSDVISALIKAGKISYDEKTNLISIIRPNQND